MGTVSIERSELISGLLEKRGIPHQVLNAKHHQREAEIVAQAGRLGAVTIATNMAGRGTDIILGGNPEAMAWAKLQEKYPTRLEVPQEEWDALVREIEQREQMKAEGRVVAGMGGLHILGTERHEARRIDLQLRGRCGRQGDPGSSRFYLSLEDDLMRIFAGEWVKNILTRLGMKEGEAIESRMVSRRIEGAQKKVEERNFEIRKNLLEYDEVMDEQRKRVYGYRQNILDGANCKQLILEMIDQQIDHYLDQFLDKDYGTETFAEWAGKQLAVEFDARDFRGMDFAAAETLRPRPGRAHGRRPGARSPRREPARGGRAVGMELGGAGEVGQHPLAPEPPRPRPEAAWPRSGGRFPHRAGPGGRAEDRPQRRRRGSSSPTSACRPPAAGCGTSSASSWRPTRSASLEPPAFKQLVREKAQAAYEEKEIAYPVMAGLYHFTTRDASGHKRYDREELAEWAAQRFHVELSIEDLKNKQRDEIRDAAGRAQPASSPAGKSRRWPRPTPGSAASSTPDVPADEALRDGLRRRPAEGALRLAGREVQLRTCRRRRCSAATPSGSNAI